MTYGPHTANLNFAREAQQMAKNATGRDSQIFQTIALISMVTIAVSGGTQVLLQLYKELNKREQEKGRGR